MKRYYTIDITQMKTAGLNPTEWTICENIHFMQATSDSGYCESDIKDLAEYHGMSLSRIKAVIGELVSNEFLKINKKYHLRTTQKWSHNKLYETITKDGK